MINKNLHQVVLVGLKGSGKTALFRQIDLIGNPNSFLKTPNSNNLFDSTQLHFSDLSIHLIDITSIDECTPIIRSSEVFVLMYNVTKGESLGEVVDEIFIKIIAQQLRRDLNPQIYLVGTHSDLPDQFQVSDHNVADAVSKLSAELMRINIVNKVYCDEVMIENKKRIEKKISPTPIRVLNDPHPVKSFQICTIQNIGPKEIFDTIKADIERAKLGGGFEDQGVVQNHLDVDVEDNNGGKNTTGGGGCEIV